MDQDNNFDKSEFNSVVAFMFAVRTIWDQCILMRQQELLNEYFKLLLSADIELDYYMSDAQKEKSANMIMDLSAALSVANNKVLLSKGRSPTDFKLFNQLGTYQKFLKAVWCKQGFEMKSRDDPGKALRNG